MAGSDVTLGGARPLAKISSCGGGAGPWRSSRSTTCRVGEGAFVARREAHRPPPQLSHKPVGEQTLDLWGPVSTPPLQAQEPRAFLSSSHRDSWRGIPGYDQNLNPCYSRSRTANHKQLQHAHAAQLARLPIRILKTCPPFLSSSHG
jgi:hypothetical protein